MSRPRKSSPTLTDMKEHILKYLPAECPWRDTLYWYRCVDSTNTRAKELARQNCAHGTVVIAEMQSDGRGRMGRQFYSPAGRGIYLSVVLRPACPALLLMHLTCAAAVAACNAVRDVTGVYPNIKWVNDLLLGGKKLGGILTELSTDPGSGNTDYAVIGIGINISQAPGDFPPELQDIATSLRMALGTDVSPAKLCAALIFRIWQMSESLISGKDEIMDFYRVHCVTLGQQIRIHQPDHTSEAFAVGIDESGSLLVSYPDGTSGCLSMGEVSIRPVSDGKF